MTFGPSPSQPGRLLGGGSDSRSEIFFRLRNVGATAPASCLWSLPHQPILKCLPVLVVSLPVPLPPAASHLVRPQPSNKQTHQSPKNGPKNGPLVDPEALSPIRSHPFPPFFQF
jgi:hypothetical protein